MFLTCRKGLIFFRDQTLSRLYKNYSTSLYLCNFFIGNFADVYIGMTHRKFGRGPRESFRASVFPIGECVGTKTRTQNTSKRAKRTVCRGEDERKWDEQIREREREKKRGRERRMETKRMQPRQHNGASTRQNSRRWSADAQEHARVVSPRNNEYFCHPLYLSLSSSPQVLRLPGILIVPRAKIDRAEFPRENFRSARKQLSLSLSLVSFPSPLSNIFLSKFYFSS